MFDISFEGRDKNKHHVWQTSWGISTRSIGVAILFHGDDKGLVLPPRVARYQVVIVPIYAKNMSMEIVNEKCSDIKKQLLKAGIRVHFDNRDNYNPGWKYNHWELKGVPVRIEIGPKDIEKKQV